MATFKNSLSSGPSWQLDEDEKKILQQSIQQSYSREDAAKLAATTQQQDKDITIALQNKAYMDHTQSVALQKQIYEYENNLRRLGLIGYDVGEALKGVQQIQSAKSDLTMFQRQFKNEEEYTVGLKELERRQTYAGKSYDELKNIAKTMQAGEERDWLEAYANSDEVMTGRDYERLIREAEGRLKWLEETNEKEEGWLVDQSGNSYLGYTGKNDAEIVSIKKDLERYKAGLWRKENEDKYSKLTELEDFDEVSRNIDKKQANGFGIGFGDNYYGTGDYVYSYINDINGTQTKSMQKNPGSSGNSGLYKYSFMNKDEIKKYNYLHNTEGKKAADEYLNYIGYELDARRIQGIKDSNAELAGEHPVLASALSVPANLLSGLGLVDVAFQNAGKGIKEAFTGEYAGPINYNSWAMSPNAASSSIRGTVAQDLADKYGAISLDEEEHPILGRIFNGKSLGDVYQLGMSMADSAAIWAMVPVFGKAGTVLLGGSAGTQGMLDALAKGASDEQALMMGFFNGAFETLFEEWSLDKLINGASRNLVVAFFKQGFVEGSEEFNTTIFNNLADLLVMAEKSDYKQKIAYFEAQGMSEEQATKQALIDQCIGLAWDFIGGFASGGLMGAGGAVINTVQGNMSAKKTYGADVQALVDEALDIDPGNKLAQKIQNKLNVGKDATGGQIYNLVQQNEAGILEQDKADIKNRTAERLTQLGETGDVHAISEALAKQAAGERLSLSEKKTIQDSKYGQRVANELKPENIRSGEYSSAWAEKIDTSRINAEEYSRLVEAAQETQESAENVAGVDTTTIADAQQASPAAAVEQKSAATETVFADNTESSEAESVQADSGAIKPVANVSTAAVPAESKVTLEGASQKYGVQAEAMRKTYNKGQDIEQFSRAYDSAWEMGNSGVSLDYVMKSESTGYLTEQQREIAYRTGKAAADSKAKERGEKIGSNGKTGRRKGTVKGEDVSIADLKKSFNDSQGRAYKVLSTIAEVTGIDIVLYKSKASESGRFEDAQGRFEWKDDKIYIDINAGLLSDMNVGDLAKYTMLRTFSHEFTHFIEKWSPVQYNEFRELVFNKLTEQGEDVEALIDSKLAQDNSGKLTYELASREVVAEAMTDILPDSSFVQELADKHQNIFQKLLEKLKEFVSELKEYYKGLSKNPPSREARALREQTGDTVKYMEDIVKMFDKIAVEAVESYQSANAVDEETNDEWSGINSAEIKAELDKRAEARAAGEATQADNMLEAAAKVYEASDNIGEAKTADEVERIAAAPKALRNDSAYARLASVLKTTSVKRVGGYEFRTAYLPGVGHSGSIKAYSDGYVSNARGLNYTSNMYKSRGEAIDDIIAVARNNNLLAETAEIREEATAHTPSERLALKLLERYINEENINRDGKALTAKELYALADEAFGGTQTEGAYNRKDAYDAMELAVNKFLLDYAGKAHRSFNGTAQNAASTVEFMEDMLSLLPTQSVRTQEQQDYQQFSTPPNIAYLAAWAGNITNKDLVLEPSAGIGGLAVFAKAWGAEVAVNELSKRRLEVLSAMGFDHLFNENAEQIDNILPDNISPSVVIMNPPFSSTAGRLSNNKTANAEKHIDQALARLRDGGRLVAILGKGMNNTDYARYWNKLRSSYDIRANLSIDGSNYKKYGTTWGVQLVVIDKTGKQTGETLTGNFTDLREIPKVLEGIRNDRNTEIEPASTVTGGEGTSFTGRTGKGQDTVSDAADMVDKRASGNTRGRNRADAGRTDDNARNSIGEQPDGVQNDNGTDRRDSGGPAVLNGGIDSAVEDSSQTPAAEQAGKSIPDNGRLAVDDSREFGAERSVTDTELARSGEVEQSDDGVYATFVAPEIPINGGKKHPAVLVESAAMAAVSMPAATYKPKLPANVIKNNLSDAQLVTVTYAGQAHEQKLPDGRRKGFFIGDGTGVGKGRQIAGIILDNFMQGRTKAVWISKNNDLYGDAIRDWTATTGRSKDEVISHNKIKPKDKIGLKEGILYSTYDTLKSQKGGNRLDQIVEWLGEDFDGVIAFDEAHNMGNLFGKQGKFGKSKGSQKATAGVELQKRLPNARIIYVSATAATEVDNLAYAERIGLWGKGTSFVDAKDFISKIGSSGLAAMELVIRDMKAMGVYVARSISYNGVNYDTVEHGLTPMQTEIYNTMSRAWQKTMSNVQTALETTGGAKNGAARQRALGNFYSAMQRFYNQVLTSMSMPSVIADMRRELAKGHSCVLQIVNTNEAQQNKALAEAKANGESLDDLDLTPREALIGYLMNSFPTQMFEEYLDDNGNMQSRPVLDSAGNPVQNKEAIRQRDALIAEVNQMSIPDGPLEMLFDAFGTEAVAENTGRGRRVVPKKMKDGSMGRVEERRTLNHRTADVQAFQDGKKRILVFSDAGGTGKSYHADRTEKNQQLRVHYVLQPGWVASNAVQGFGRTHRSNEASPPVYKLVTTNIKGQKRFTSTIARRLDQLGALTKGQRDTGSGMFGAKDNLETDLAKDSLREFYSRLGKNQIEGISGIETLDRLGLKQKFTDEYGAFKLNDSLARDISTFLNRILALEVDEQNRVFDAFISIYEMELEAAIQAGTLDTGMENVKADRIEVIDDKVIRQDETTGAATHYIQAKTYTKPKVITTAAEMAKKREGFVGIYKTESGTIKAVFRIADKTTEWGGVQKQFRLVGPNSGAKTSVWNEDSLAAKAKAVEKADWQREWDEEVKRVPEYNEDTLHMLTGALLPIWNYLPQEGSTKVKRLIAHDGITYLGRVIDKDMIDDVLRGFDIGRTKEVFTAQQLMNKAINSGVRFYLRNNRAQIFRSRVSGEWRLEIIQPQNTWYLMRSYPGLIQERIQYRDRYFIPTGANGEAILNDILADNPVKNTAEDIVQEQNREYLKGNLSFTSEEVATDEENVLKSFGIEKSRSKDYIHVQKQVLSTLDAENFWDSEGKVSVVVEDGGEVVEIGRKGIKETLNDKNYSHTSKQNRILKLATVRLLPEIIKNSHMTEGNVENYHVEKQSSTVYDYFKSEVTIGNDPLAITIAVRRSTAKNRFWVHSVKIEKEQPHNLPDRSQGIPMDTAHGNSIAVTGGESKENVPVSQAITSPMSKLPKASWEISPGNAIQDQQRSQSYTDREVLAVAASDVKLEGLTPGEEYALQTFKDRLTKLQELQEKRREQGQLYKEQQFGANVDRAEAQKTLNRMKVLDGQIQRASNEVLKVEEAEVLKRVLKEARKVVEQQERQHGQELLRRYRDRRNNAAAIKKYRERIRGDVDELSKWVLHPNNKDALKHVPDALKDTVIPFLTSIDFTSKQQLRGGEATKADAEFMKKLRSLNNALKQNQDIQGLYSGYNDLPPDFMRDLQNFIETTQEIVDNKGGEFVINQMTAEELRDLSKMVRALKQYITTMNRFHVNAMFQHVYSAGESSIEFMKELKPAKNTGAVSNFLLWQQMRPAYAFERFGEGGKAIYDGLRRGQATLAFNTREITEFAEKAYTAAEVKAWEKQTKSFKLGSDTVVMPISHMMALYELSKRPQALGHILGRGVRVATFIQGKEKISDIGHELTPGDVSTIIQGLTPRQKEVADKLQKYMAEQGGKWGNHVSVARFGEELFGEEHYFPIHSDGRHLQATADEHPSAASLYALLNMGFTKELNENANNRLVLYSIFDVFSNHMASMAQYNAFALPVLDALKWFNYQSTMLEDGRKVHLGSVREEMARAYGVPEETRPGSGRQGYAESFVINIIKAFNGTEAQGVPTDTTGLNELRRYNMAQVAYNARVVVQQPMAITRAGMIIGYDSIIRGLRLAPSAIKANIEEMQKYSGIAAWKALGFYDVNISRGLTSIIKHDETALDKVAEVGMWGAEQADQITWAAMWSACKEEVMHKQKLKTSDVGFYEAVTKLFEEVIYKTQVVDGVLTKNEFLRSKGFFSRAIGSFMSEPTTTASMLINAYDQYSRDLQRGLNRTQAWHKNRGIIVRTAAVYAIGALLLAAVQGVADAWRDDDDYETFTEKWLEAFKGNFIDEFMPFNKLPYANDIYEVAKSLLAAVGVDTYGNEPRSVLMQWRDSLVKGTEIIWDLLKGEDTNYTWYGGVYKLLQAAAGITGLPVAAATRECVTAWNNTVGAMAPSLKVKSYDSGEKNSIKYAFKDGYLTEDEASEQLIIQGIAKDENEAYWLIQEWSDEDGSYSKYDKIYSALLSGGDVKVAMQELLDHGYTEDDIVSRIKTQVSKWYKGTETETPSISKQQAVNMLSKYGGMSGEEAAAKVNEWSAKVETGIEYADITDALLSGEITRQKAAEMWQKYGGLTAEKAESKALKTEYQEKYPDWESTSISDAAYAYSLYGKSAGMSETIFFEACYRCGKFTGTDNNNDGKTDNGSIQKERWAYIDSLAITAAQKDALHLAFYKESTLSKTPWH